MSDVAIEFNHVWKKFQKGELHDSLRDLIPALFARNHKSVLRDREFWALEDISFQIRRGDTLGIVGPNGAGKSTILKLLSRILKPSQGTVRVHGRLSALIEVGAGFHPDLTGRENIYLNGVILGMKKSEIDKKLDEIVDFAGLEEFIDTPVKRYSSGMYARLGFSVAAHVDPEILLVDEVLSVGDMRFQEKCITKMLSFKSEGIPIVFVSHNLPAVSTLCSTAAFISGGKVHCMGPTGDVIKTYISSPPEVDPTCGYACIENIRLVMEKDRPVSGLSPGQQVNLKFSLKLDAPLEDCILGFLVFRFSDALPVCDYNIPLSSIKNCAGTESIDCVVKFDANLLRDAYTIGLHVLHAPTCKFLLFVKNVVFFSVEEQMSWQGVAHLNPKLTATAEPSWL